MPEDNVHVDDHVMLTLRSYFSIVYFQTAAQLARTAERIEAGYAGFDAAQDAEHKGAVMASILMTIAGLEAFINEFYTDCADRQTFFLDGLERAVIDRVARAW